MTSTLERAAPSRPTPVRLFWLGVTGGVLGALAETVFMLLTRGELQNRSSFLFGQFSLVWGGAAALLTLLLPPLAKRGKGAVFLAGALAGTAFELFCSWFQELCFGVVFWDYSHLPFSIGGRINLIFSCFWGGAATLWIFWVMPWLNGVLDRVPPHILGPVTLVTAVVLTLDAAFTFLALVRLDARQAGLFPRNGLELFLDRRWSDQRLFDRFTMMRHLEEYTLEHPDFW